MGWDLRPLSDSMGSTVTPVTAYVYGVVVVLAAVIALGEWVGRRRQRTHDEHKSAYQTYAVMAVLWPLFIATVIFIVLWTILAPRRR